MCGGFAVCAHKGGMEVLLALELTLRTVALMEVVSVGFCTDGAG